jgi:hypothetical protein
MQPADVARVAEAEDFSHGSYGDYSGVVFYGPPTNGFWLDRLAVSDIYIDPLFRGILDRAWRESDGERIPRLAADWNTGEGWVADGGPVPVAGDDAAELIGALAQLDPADVAEHCAGCTAEKCLRCASVVQDFIGTRLARGVSLFIKDE